MPRIDLNPLQSGGSVDPLSDPLGAGVKAVMLMASFGVFFALMSAGRATFEPLVQNVVSMVPGLKTGSNSGGPWQGW